MRLRSFGFDVDLTVAYPLPLGSENRNVQARAIELTTDWIVDSVNRSKARSMKILGADNIPVHDRGGRDRRRLALLGDRHLTDKDALASEWAGTCMRTQDWCCPSSFVQKRARLFSCSCGCSAASAGPG